MSVHVAILLPRYLRMILAGDKTIESRLTKTARAPFRAIEAGERIFFKASSGPYMATAIVQSVTFHDALTPSHVSRMKSNLNRAICGDDAYWEWKADSNYATLVTLADVLPVSVGPKMPPSRGVAWFVLPDGVGPAVFNVPLTAGAIRNRYVRIPRGLHAFPEKCYGGATARDAGTTITFEWPDDECLVSDVLPNGMVRSRKWSALFAKHDVKPGDELSFVQRARHRYGVSVIKR